MSGLIKKENYMLIDKIKSDFTAFRIAKNNVATSVLSVLIGDAELIGKKKENRPPTDEEVQGVIKSHLDKMIETRAHLVSYNQPEKIAIVDKEIEIISQYRPKQLNEEELYDAISSIVKDNNISNMTGLGIVMGSMKKTYPGKYDAIKAKTVFESLIG